MSRKPEDLSPEMQILYEKFRVAMEAAGQRFILTCTYRSQQEQDALYAQGRTDIQSVNDLRQRAGLPPIKPHENSKVTWTRKSNHTQRTAFDIAMLDKNHKLIWKVIAYKPAGEIGKQIGLAWGGDFRDKNGRPIPDYPHFEMKKT